MNRCARRRLGLTLLVAATGVLAAPAAPVAAEGGDLVRGFGAGGLVTLTGGAAEKRLVAVQPDGKVVVVVDADSSPVVLRLLPDGRADTTFSRDGRVPLEGVGEDVVVSSLALDGNKVVVGSTENRDGTVMIRVDRLTGTGRWDSTFGGDGRVTIEENGEVREVGGIVVDRSHRVLLTAHYTTDRALRAVVRRLTPSGAPDRTFSGDGSAPMPAPAGNSTVPFSIDVDREGQIVVGGTSVVLGSARTVVGRLDPSGAPVRSFGTSGHVVISVDGLPVTMTNDVQFDSAGRILGGGTSSPSGVGQFRVYTFRLRANGALDPRFAGDGVRTIAMGSKDIYGGAFAQQSDGAIVVVASSIQGVMLIVRLTPRGAFDRSFDTDGRTTVDFSPNDLSAQAVVVDPTRARAYTYTFVDDEAGVVAVSLG